MVAIDAPPQALHDALAVRQQARDGRLTGPTAGLAPGFVQANLTILPAALADDFLRFCQRNTKPCPLLAVSWVIRLPALFLILVRPAIPTVWKSRWISPPVTTTP